MKLVIQIPCLNEERTLPLALAALPREVEGFDEVAWLVIDDGSHDRTSTVARECGVDHIVRFTSNKGLATAFQAGLDAALKLGADVVVNTDADDQYRAGDIPLLVAPILAGEADVVIGDRGVGSHDGFSPSKRALQRMGSWVVRQASGTDVPDATSGFRAYDRQAALSVNVASRFTYTLETIIQAGRSDITVAHVPIGTNPALRDSRLFRSNTQYVRRSMGTLLRLYAMYRPLRFFLLAAAVFGGAGLALFARFAFFYLTEPGPTGHVQSLVVGGVLLVVAVLLGMLGVLAELLRNNRLLIERTLRKVRAIELAVGVEAEGLDDRPAGRPRERT